MNNLQPIQPSIAVTLQPDEEVYGEYKAIRGGFVDSFTNKSGNGLLRAAAGGVLFGGAGAVVGAVTGSRNSESVADKKYQLVDLGKLLITNKRIVFVGQGFIQIPHGTAHTLGFQKASFSQIEQYRKMANKKAKTFKDISLWRIPSFRKPIVLSMLYEGGLNGEEYIITDKKADEAKDCYELVISANAQK